MEHYFLYSYSGKGFSDLSHHLHEKLHRIVYANSMNPHYFDHLINHIKTSNLRAEVVLDSVDPTDIIGIVLPSYKVGFFKNTAGYSNENRAHIYKYSSDIEVEITGLLKEIEKKEKKVLEKFSEAQQYHHETNTLYESVLFDDAYKHIIEDIKSILNIKKSSDAIKSPHTHPLVDHLFISALTYHGPVDLHHKFMNKVKQKIILKGNIGRYKSKMLEDISHYSKEIGYPVIQCHCPFEPTELDMVIIPDLDMMIVDGEQPHEIEISHPEDKQIDLTVECLDRFEILKEISRIKEGTAKYKQKMRQGTLYLQDLRKLKQQLLFITYEQFDDRGDVLDFKRILSEIEDDIS